MVLEVRNISKSFGKKRILTDVSFGVDRGEILGFIGPNGAGKTTAIKIILGLLSADGGTVYINGKNIAENHDEALRSVGAIIESPELYPYLSGRENLMQYARLYSLHAARVDECLREVGLYDHCNTKLGKYSLGMRQRIGLAQAMLHLPSLYVLDEPTNHLDIASREMLGEALAAYDGTLLCVSHDRYFIRQLANGILEIAPQPDKSDYRIYKCGYEEYTILRGNPAADAPACRQKAAAGKMSFEEAKQKKNRLRSAKVRYEKLEIEIAECEKQLADIRSRLESESVAGDYKALSELYQKQTDAEKKSEAMYEELMELEEFIGSEGE